MTNLLVNSSSKIKPSLTELSQHSSGNDAESVSFSVAQICSKLIQIEQDLKLFEWQIKDVYIWPLLRMPIYYELTKKLGVFGAPHGTSHWKGRRFQRAKLWSYAFFKNLFTPKTPCDFMLVEHSRKVNKDGLWVDIYTDHLTRRLQTEPLSFCVYENLSYQSSTHQYRSHPHSYYDSIMTWARLLAKVSFLSLTAAQKSKIKTLEDKIFELFHLKIPLTKKIKNRVLEFNFARRSYQKLLKIRQPKALLVVVSYSHTIAPLTAAAKSLAIPTIEMQHGTFSPYHLGYHFPHLDHHPYFCDYFFSFGPFWHAMADLPLPDEKIMTFGFPHLSEQLTKLNTNAEVSSVKGSSQSNSVLFLSQGVIGEGLAKYAVACSQAQLPWHLRYKLHPSEYNTWRSDYPLLAEQSDAGLIEVIDHHRLNLYDLMRKAQYQVGVFSTAVYEGMALGCQTLLIDLPGLEYMNALIEQNFAEKITSPQQLCQRLKRSTDQPETIPDQNDFEPKQIFSELQEDSIQWLLNMVKD